MKEVIPHIYLDVHDNGHLVMMVKDHELFRDFMEDFLYEVLGTPYEYLTKTETIYGQVIFLHFPFSTNFYEIEQKLLKISTEEIERIYHLNNKE